MRLQPQMLDIIDGLLPEAQEDTEKTELYRLLAQVKELDQRLALDLEAAANAQIAEYIDRAFIVGFKAGRDPSLLVFMPEEPGLHDVMKSDA